jgi:hypothetical protein
MLQINAKAHLALAVAAALGLAGTPTIGQATEFTPEGAANWVGIARSLTVAIDSGNEQTRACEGINAFAGMRADFRREVSTTRGWAPQAHFQTCSGLHANAQGNGVKCKSYRRAVGELAKANAATDPADVVAVAGMLKDSLNSIIAEFEEAKLC